MAQDEVFSIKVSYLSCVIQDQNEDKKSSAIVYYATGRREAYFLLVTGQRTYLSPHILFFIIQTQTIVKLTIYWCVLPEFSY